MSRLVTAAQIETYTDIQSELVLCAEVNGGSGVAWGLWDRMPVGGQSYVPFKIIYL